MPTYDLKCEQCGNRFELFLQRLLRDTDRVCPVCGSTSVRTGIGGGVPPVRTRPSGSCAPRGGFG